MSTGNQKKQPTTDDLCINTIRTLSMDAVQKANSGHPGAPMGLAPAGYVLWTRVMKHNPQNPDWPDRDRFVLSGGHASMLLYSLLHLTGYDLSLEEIQNFRQWGSKTPGHPEYGHTPGVETTTGPLGQGFANAVGMAMAERHLAASFNRPGHDIVDHHTFVMCGDGDLMEGVSAEAASLAGHLGLSKLICLYDDNGISIEGTTGIAFTENVAKRFDAYRWQTIKVEGRQRPGCHRKSHPGGQGRDQKALDHHAQNPHRPRQPQQAGHGRCPWRPAGGRRDQTDQGGTGLEGEGSLLPFPGKPSPLFVNASRQVKKKKPAGKKPTRNTIRNTRTWPTAGSMP